ncbi:MAG: substrate-binding domain-containing protein [Dermatophilaceae bacterium]
MHKFPIRSLVATGVAALLVAAGASNAHADPEFTPDANDVVGVGSDTTELVMNTLATEYNNSGDVVAGRRLASWDAVGSRFIRPRFGAGPILRPTGSFAGIDTIQETRSVTFARSSRGPDEIADRGTVFYPFARDRLNYAYAKPTSVVATNLSSADLREIYTCVKTNWQQFGGPNKRIQARIPEFGAGLRTFFLNSIGVTEEQIAEAVDQPDTRCDVAAVQSNDPAAVIDQPGAIVPFSVAKYSSLPISDKDQVSLATMAPFAPSRLVYNVLRANSVPAIGPLFDEASWICTSTRAGQVIAARGFTRLPSGQCGVGVPVP